MNRSIPWVGRRGPSVAEIVALVALAVLDAVLFQRSGPAVGWLAVVVTEFAPGLGPVVALLAVLRRRFPERIGLMAAVVSGLSLLGTAIAAVVALLGQRLPAQPSGTEVLAVALVVGSACHHLRLRPAFALAAVGGIAVAAAPVVRYGVGSPQALFSAVGALAWGAALAVGLLLRDADARAGARAAEVRTTERLRLARELHDLVAHQITGIVVRVQAAHRIAERTGGDTATLVEIEATGAEALASMRRLVGTLRTAGTHNEDLFSLPDGLAAAVDRAVPDDGTVTLDAPGNLGELDVTPEVVITVHRLITEALTNVRRHAPQAKEVRVLVHHDQRYLQVEVVNDGSVRPARPGGYGLVGMAERVAAVGGTVSAGPADGQRWRVSARLPLRSG
ncbi:histidine kinase [Amycolatopsis jiangsuensis]|uniref:histidine kinase n=1 Tax=Amycolatopsis jiangsuensis TaxID=1181879 RepID=A0A840IYW1_9PSEU|nr:histidine kinase [Amycolatopsis jiangsuensis]MBB4687866.1 signal transduction histidine kinase [Amycolatopsis jiangsuensis]